VVSFAVYIFALALIAYYDFRYREISVFTFIFLGLSEAIFIFKYFTLSILISQAIKNIFFLIILFLFLFVYFKLRKRITKGFVDVLIGKADILLLLMTSFLFNLYDFVFLTWLTAFISLVISIFIKGDHFSKLIPFAGILSIIIIVLYLQHVINYPDNGNFEFGSFFPRFYFF
jgi:hypothetical protein